MPSVLSHPAVALGFSRWFKAPRAVLAAGAIASILPDADSIGFWLGVPYGSPLGHRGLTHSLAFAAALAAVGLLVLGRRRGGLSARAVVVYLFICAASHGLLDGMTNGGHGVAYFAPFSNERFSLPWRPIPVSPISVTGFFTGRALPILAGEAVWIWAPCAALALVAGRRDRPRPQEPPRTGA